MDFPRFSEFPLELQDLVWELCIPNPPPVAHVAQLQRAGIQTYSRSSGHKRLRRDKLEPSLKRSCTPKVTTEPYLGLDRPTTLRTLLQTTSRSRAVSLRHADALAPIESAILVEGSSTVSDDAQIPYPALRINAATDLVVLEAGWYLEFASLPGFSGCGMRCPEPLHYLAVPYPGRKELSNGIYALLSAYQGLEVLYMLIEPGELCASEQPWPEDLEWPDKPWPEEDEYSLETYIAAYVEGRIRPGRFRCGRREYFEIPAQKIRSLGGLGSMIVVLETWRALRAQRQDGLLADNMISMAEGKADTEEGREPVRFRLLSWRDV